MRERGDNKKPRILGENMDDLQYLISDGQPVGTKCPYCERLLDGPIVDGMHAECSEQFGEDLNESYPGYDLG